MIDAFLARELADHSWIKHEKNLDAAMPPGYEHLWNHQKACFLILNELKRFIVHIGMGGGKTLLTLSVLKHNKVKALVFVPYLTAVETWVEEVKKHVPELRCVALNGSGPDNLRAMAGEGDLFVVCYQTAVAMYADRGKAKWQLDTDLVRQSTARFGAVVFDEIHKCKSVSSLTYKMCRAISAQTTFAIGLTGTPFASDVSDLWPQFHLMDAGETLGPSLTFFREAFFTKRKNYWGGYEYTFKQRLMPTLQKFIKNRSIAYSVDEFADMPPKVYQQRRLTLPKDSRVYAEAALQQLRAHARAGEYQETANSYNKLQQLGSGFMTLKGEDTGKVQIEFPVNPKLDALEEILDAASTEKLVCFHHFVYTANVLSNRLASLGVDHVCINGSVRDPVGRLRRFKDDSGCRVLVINCRSGSSSLNLQLANYVIFFEQPTSPIDRQQAEARCWRPGQDKRVFIIDLLMQGTADERQFKANQSGEDLLKCLLTGSDF